MEDKLKFIGLDGGNYETWETLLDANQRYHDLMFPKEVEKGLKNMFIVYDAERGKMDIAPGVGEIDICIGHKIDTNEFGKQSYVPVYQTRRF
jgi:hypothetical protein